MIGKRPGKGRGENGGDFSCLENTGECAEDDRMSLFWVCVIGRWCRCDGIRDDVAASITTLCYAGCCSRGIVIGLTSAASK